MTPIDNASPCPKCGKKPQLSCGTRFVRAICTECKLRTTESKNEASAVAKWDAGEIEEYELF